MDQRTALEQGTPEWHAARVGQISSTRGAPIVGESDFQTREGLMREMVQEYFGERVPLSGPALDWGNDHENDAIAEYERRTGSLVISTGIHVSAVHSWLQSSPDGLVGDDGLIEAKCPYSQKIRALAESPAYAIQIQIHLFCTGRQWCDFIVWTPDDYHCERVYPDPQMMGDIIPQLKAFHEEYEAIIADAKLAKQYRAPVERDDAAWTDAVKRFRHAKNLVESAKADEQAAKEELVRLADGDNVKGAGCTVSHYARAGSIDTKAAEAAGLDLSPYRKPSNISTRVTIK